MTLHLSIPLGGVIIPMFLLTKPSVRVRDLLQVIHTNYCKAQSRTLHMLSHAAQGSKAEPKEEGAREVLAGDVSGGGVALWM